MIINPSDVRTQAIDIMAKAAWEDYEHGEYPLWSQLPDMSPGQQESERKRASTMLDALEAAGLIITTANASPGPDTVTLVMEAIDEGVLNPYHFTDPGYADFQKSAGVVVSSIKQAVRNALMNFKPKRN